MNKLGNIFKIVVDRLKITCRLLISKQQTLIRKTNQPLWQPNLRIFIMTQAQPLTKMQEQQVLQGAVAHALLKANTEHEARQAAKQSHQITIMKPTAAAANSEIPMIIPRIDLLGNNILFLANTLDRDANTLQMWDMKHGSKPRVVSKAFYDSTLPLTDKPTMTQMVQDYCKEFKATEAILRARLIKGNQIAKADDGSISKEAQEAWKNEMKAKFKAAFERAVDDAFANM